MSKVEDIPVFTIGYRPADKPAGWSCFHTLKTDLPRLLMQVQSAIASDYVGRVKSIDLEQLEVDRHFNAAIAEETFNSLTARMKGPKP